ncbi:type VI toxin-antitoxin system SocB family DNA replication inhibitor toxin [Agrobacterium fabrum]|uniref:type VI toxin-antitoxin system SocB family DNA replication inhibitor toxin n=1 Tax=Agrobacterium fabrum TaxID=1176649 RepID=UPI003BA3779A
MTIPPLPDIDLARVAPLSEDRKWAVLQKMKGGFSTFSYRPVVGSYSDIFNVQLGMLGEAPPTSLKQIEHQVGKACRSVEERRNNLQVAKALHAFTATSGIVGRRQEFFPLNVGVGKKVSFWLPMVVAIKEQPYAVFIDPRRTKGLTREARRFVFSMMHERIRAADADFAAINLGIIQFRDDKDDCRTVRLFTDHEVELFDFSELESMVSSTYRIWQEIHEEREVIRRKGTGTGPLI